MSQAAPRTPGPDQPSSARITNYLLGGHDHTAADRAKAAEIEAIRSRLRVSCPSPGRWRRTAACSPRGRSGGLCAGGIRQVIDLGCGLPAADTVHAVARSVHPAARVAYVDHDPEVTDYLADVMPVEGGREGIAVVSADLRDPAAVWSDPGLKGVIYPDVPVCFVMTLVLHFLPPGRPGWWSRSTCGWPRRGASSPSACRGLTIRTRGRGWRRRTRPGSGTTRRGRSRGLLRGLELVPPGVCAAAGLRPGLGGLPRPARRSRATCSPGSAGRPSRPPPTARPPRPTSRSAARRRARTGTTPPMPRRPG